MKSSTSWTDDWTRFFTNPQNISLIKQLTIIRLVCLYLLKSWNLITLLISVVFVCQSTFCKLLVVYFYALSNGCGNKIQNNNNNNEQHQERKSYYEEHEFDNNN